MRSFTIAIPFIGARRSEVELALKILAKFISSVGKRYRENTRLLILDNGENLEVITQLLRKYRMKERSVIYVHEQETFPDKWTNENTFAFLPFMSDSSSWIRKALSKGMPVIASKEANRRLLLDTSCGVTFNFHEEGDSDSQIAAWLEMLVMDPGAQDILMVGAIKKNVLFKARDKSKIFTKVA